MIADNARIERGFTLIELLVVVAIIGILSSVVLASLNNARSKGRDARRIADIRQIQLALEMYYDSSGTNEYPEEVSGRVPESALAPDYIAKVPLDPQTGVGYEYENLIKNSDGTYSACTATTQVCTSYVLMATMENTAPAGDIDGVVSTKDCTDPVYCVQP